MNQKEKMKRILIITGIVVAIIGLAVFNSMISKKNVLNTYAEVKKGTFEITVTNSGELNAEKSIDIKGPVIGQASGQGDSHGDMRQGGFSGMDMRAMDMKIQDIVPEGTLVKEGDYVAQLDRSSYNNTLKSELDKLSALQANLQMKILDTAVVLTNLRDDIKNQTYVVEETAIVLDQSKYEPPATIRKAEMNLDKARRTLEQKKRGYSLKLAQSLSEINTQKLILARRTRYVSDLEEFLTKFTVTAPSSGMVIYKKDRSGSKRKEGSSVNPFDMVIATLPDLTTMISRVFVSEIDVSKVKSGQKVNIVVDAFPKKPFTGSVVSIANVGEQLPNSDAKMFEVLVKVDGSDPALRPSMTTGNRIIIKTFYDAVYIPTECVQTGSDSIPYVYEKNRTKQIVKPGEANEKNIIIEQGLEPGTTIYLIPPANPGKFKLTGENLISVIKGTKQGF
ncbi:MAG: RND transporter [Odoribacter sp.]|nr:RND transporter [Odoribacter sp.]